MYQAKCMPSMYFSKGTSIYREMMTEETSTYHDTWPPLSTVRQPMNDIELSLFQALSMLETLGIFPLVQNGTANLTYFFNNTGLANGGFNASHLVCAGKQKESYDATITRILCYRLPSCA